MHLYHVPVVRQTLLFLVESSAPPKPLDALNFVDYFPPVITLILCLIAAILESVHLANKSALYRYRVIIYVLQSVTHNQPELIKYVHSDSITFLQK